MTTRRGHSQGPLLRPQTFQPCSSHRFPVDKRTRAQEHMGWKSLQINAWQWKCSCSWKSVGTAMHESNSWDWMLVKHTRLHNSTSCFSQCLSVKLKVSTLYKPTWKVGRNCPLFSLQAFSSELCIYKMTTRSIEYIHPKYLLKVYKLNFGPLR